MIKSVKFQIATLLWVLCTVFLFFPPPEAAIETLFSRGWYRWVLSLTTPVTQSLQFPAALGLISAAATAVLIRWIRYRVAFSKSDNLTRRGSTFLRLIRNIYLALPFLLGWFLVFWGAGYQRIPAADRLGLGDGADWTTEEASFREYLLETVVLNETPAGRRDSGNAIAAVSAAMRRTVEEWDGSPISLPAQVKAVPRGTLLLSGTSGICVPFTLEPLVDSALPDATFVSTAAHELGHIAGFCAEDEATFIGHVAGLLADDRFARYACALSAYMDLIGRLKGDEFKAAFEVLPPQAKRDLEEARDVYHRYRIDWFGKLTFLLYDRYLKVQGIQDGVQNYSRGIDLLESAWRKGMLPDGPP